MEKPFKSFTALVIVIELFRICVLQIFWTLGNIVPAWATTRAIQESVCSKLLEGDLWPLGPEEIEQEFSSQATSINKTDMPTAIKALVASGEFRPGEKNLDIGGGRFDNVTEFLDERGIKNYTYDPFNRTRAHNQAVVAKASGAKVDTVTINNVLNVIQERDNWTRVLLQAEHALRPGGKIYIQIYEGKKDWTRAKRERFQVLASKGQWGKIFREAGAGPTTAESWQNKLPIEAYLPFVQDFFPNARIVRFTYKTARGKKSIKLIVAEKVF